MSTRARPSRRRPFIALLAVALLAAACEPRGGETPAATSALGPATSAPQAVAATAPPTTAPDALGATGPSTPPPSPPATLAPSPSAADTTPLPAKAERKSEPQEALREMARDASFTRSAARIHAAGRRC